MTSPERGEPHRGQAFRRTAGHFASDVTVVTTRTEEDWYGITVSSFASLSLNLLLVNVSVRTSNPVLAMIRHSGRFGISVLSGHQQDVATYFASPGRRPEPAGFSGVDSVAQVTGVPLIAEALSWFDYEVQDILCGRDHDIVLGRVLAAGGGSGTPLVYWADGYRALGDDLAFGAVAPSK